MLPKGKLCVLFTMNLFFKGKFPEIVWEVKVFFTPVEFSKELQPKLFGNDVGSIKKIMGRINLAIYLVELLTPESFDV